MDKHVQEFNQFLLNKGIDEKEVTPYLRTIKKNTENKKSYEKGEGRCQLE